VQYSPDSGYRYTAARVRPNIANHSECDRLEGGPYSLRDSKNLAVHSHGSTGEEVQDKQYRPGCTEMGEIPDNTGQVFHARVIVSTGQILYAR
jgi:hypothetical protein